jgi:hypothetical protein
MPNAANSTVKSPLTICIAAICENGKSVVAASDRMITAGFLALEYEHPRPKLDRLSSSVVGLTAGDALIVTELFGLCRDKIQELQSPRVARVADVVKDQFIALRKRQVEELYLRPRGLTLKEFYRDGLINRLPDQLAFTLDNDMSKLGLNLDVIIAGVDETGAHIYGVDDPGALRCYDRMGFHGVGSGLTHALLTLAANQHCQERSLNETVFLVYESKKKAELAPGVGPETEIGIITANGIVELSDEDKRHLQEIYDKKVAPQLEEVEEAVADLRFADALREQKNGQERYD